MHAFRSREQPCDILETSRQMDFYRPIHFTRKNFDNQGYQYLKLGKDEGGTENASDSDQHFGEINFPYFR